MLRRGSSTYSKRSLTSKGAQRFHTTENFARLTRSLCLLPLLRRILSSSCLEAHLGGVFGFGREFGAIYCAKTPSRRSSLGNVPSSAMAPSRNTTMRSQRRTVDSRWVAFLLPLGTICRCQTPFRAAILPSKPPGIWRMSANRSAAQTVLSLIHQTLPRSLPCCDVPFDHSRGLARRSTHTDDTCQGRY